MRTLLCYSCCLLASVCLANDTAYLKVHFLYGSRPLKAYKDAEPKWFGGVLGGHVGIEGDSGQILNFVPNGDFHVFKKTNKGGFHSAYAVHDEPGFYRILGGDADSVKKAVIIIPVTAAQKQLFDSLSAAYQQQTPYDYALFGMRCGSAAYEILAQLDLLKRYPPKKTALKILYPRKLRKRLLKKASSNSWTVVRQEGSPKRGWERD